MSCLSSLLSAETYLVLELCIYIMFVIVAKCRDILGVEAVYMACLSRC